MEAKQNQLRVRQLISKILNQKKVFTITLLLTITTFCAQAQKPDPPVFRYISNDLTSGQITLGWNRSPSPDSLIFGYYIYRLQTDLLGNQGYILIDSTNASTFSYTDIYVDGSVKTESYKMATKGKTEPSKLTDYHTTMIAF